MDAKEEATKRNRVTFYLLLAGGAILFIPLLILLYIRSTETSSGNANITSHPFAPRESVADRIKAAQTPAPEVLASNAPAGAAGLAQSQNAAPASVADSLGFIKGGSDFAPSAKPAVSTESAKPVSPPPAPTPPPQVAKATPAAVSKTKAGPKSFKQPHLQGTGFSNSQRNGQMGMGQMRAGQMGMGQMGTGQMGMGQMGTGQMGQMGMGQTPAGGTRQMPSGAAMPDIGKMMQGMTGAGAAGGSGGAAMPDMGKMMQGMMPGAGAAGAAGTANPAGAQQAAPAAATPNQ